MSSSSAAVSAEELETLRASLVEARSEAERERNLRRRAEEAGEEAAGAARSKFRANDEVQRSLKEQLGNTQKQLSETRSRLEKAKRAMEKNKSIRGALKANHDGELREQEDRMAESFRSMQMEFKLRISNQEVLQHALASTIRNIGLQRMEERLHLQAGEREREGGGAGGANGGGDGQAFLERSSRRVASAGRGNASHGGAGLGSTPAWAKRPMGSLLSPAARSSLRRSKRKAMAEVGELGREDEDESSGPGARRRLEPGLATPVSSGADQEGKST